MSQCQQAHDLLMEIQALKSDLDKILDLLSRTSREKRRSVYEKLQATNYHLLTTIETLNKFFAVSIEQAREIMDHPEYNIKNVFGPAEVKTVFDIDIDPKDIPPIPFTRKELKMAVYSDQVLMLVVGKKNDDQSLTPKRMEEIIDEKLRQEKLKRRRLSWLEDKPTNKPDQFFYNATWCEEEDYYSVETPLTEINRDQPSEESSEQPRWVLISKRLISGSSYKDFLDHTQLIVNYLQTVVMPHSSVAKRKAYLEAIEEFNRKQGRLSKILSPFNATEELNYLKQVMPELSDLKVNRLFRPKLALLIYLTMIYLQVNNQSLFKGNKYVLTNTIDGRNPVFLGGFSKEKGISIGEEDYTNVNFDMGLEIGTVFYRSG